MQHLNLAARAVDIAALPLITGVLEYKFYSWKVCHTDYELRRHLAGKNNTKLILLAHVPKAHNLDV